MLLKVGKNIVWVSNSLDPGETASYSPSYLDPSCLHMGLGGLRVKNDFSLGDCFNMKYGFTFFASSFINICNFSLLPSKTVFINNLNVTDLVINLL